VAAPAVAEAVVEAPSRRPGEDAIGLFELLEVLERFRIVGDVRVEGRRPFAERLLDRVGVGLAGDAEHLVVVPRRRHLAPIFLGTASSQTLEAATETASNLLNRRAATKSRATNRCGRRSRFRRHRCRLRTHRRARGHCRPSHDLDHDADPADHHDADPAAATAASASASGAPASAGPPAAADGERAAAYASPAARAPALVSSASGRTVASASCRRRRIDLVFQRFGIGACRLDRRRGLDRALGGGLRRRRGSGRAWLLCARICSGITFVLRERPESSARADD
jgi:hypothetical protein